MGFTPLYDTMSALWNDADPVKYPGARPPAAKYNIISLFHLLYY